MKTKLTEALKTIGFALLMAAMLPYWVLIRPIVFGHEAIGDSEL